MIYSIKINDDLIRSEKSIIMHQHKQDSIDAYFTEQQKEIDEFIAIEKKMNKK